MPGGRLLGLPVLAHATPLLPYLELVYGRAEPSCVLGCDCWQYGVCVISSVCQVVLHATDSGTGEHTLLGDSDQ